MGLLDFLRGPDINKGIEEYKRTEGAALIDVRSPEEYSERNVPGSINIPLQSIGRIQDIITDKDPPLFVHCYSGSRSSAAVKALKQMGYNNAKNIGGISSYKG